MSRTNTPDAKGRILQAALQAFAMNGFEGARIDEIARLANVPKSLIYYHFKSKDDILKLLTDQFISGYRKLLNTAGEEAGPSKQDGMISRLKTHYYEFAMANVDLIRIIFIESLKKDAENPVIFQVARAIIDAEEETPAALSPGYDRNERLIAEFFTGVVPLFAYLCFRDAWLKAFGVARPYFDGKFLSALASSHGAYHKEQE